MGKRSVEDELSLRSENRKADDDVKPVVEISRNECSPVMDNVSGRESIKVNTARREIDAEDVCGHVEGLGVRPVMEHKSREDAQAQLESVPAVTEEVLSEGGGATGTVRRWVQVFEFVKREPTNTEPTLTVGQVRKGVLHALRDGKASRIPELELVKVNREPQRFQQTLPREKRLRDGIRAAHPEPFPKQNRRN